MAVTTVAKTVGTTGTFSTPQLWEDGAPTDLTTSNNWSAGSFVGTFVQGETVTGTGITGGKFLDSDGSTYITFGTTTTPAAGITITGSTSGATCVTSGSANVGVIWQGQCQNQEFSGTGTRLTISGSTSSTAAYKHLTTIAGASFRDNTNAQTNALAYNASNGAAIKATGTFNTVAVQATETNLRISNLQIANTAATDGRALALAAAGSFVDFCIFEGTQTTSSTTISTVSVTSSGTVRNSLIITRKAGATQIIATSTASPFFYNCTIVATDDLATAPTEIFQSGASGTVTVQNCGLFAGDSTKAIKAGSATFNFTTCYSDIAGTSGVTQTAYANEFNDATSDFRLRSGAAEIDTGTADPSNAANDIVGTPRPQNGAWDVGCWEFIPPVLPQFLMPRSIM